MTMPLGAMPVPDRVRARAGSAALTPVWENGIGGLTFRSDVSEHAPGRGRERVHARRPRGPGRCGRWADIAIAIAAMSTGWNYGPGWEDALVEAYDVDPDPERVAYYRELWDAT